MHVETSRLWDEIFSLDYPLGALPYLVCCVEATIVVDPRIPLEWEQVFLKIQGCSGNPEGCGWFHLFLELIADGSSRYSRVTSFLKKAEALFYLWLTVGETDLLEDSL
jgi:hypothetical protein